MPRIKTSDGGSETNCKSKGQQQPQRPAPNKLIRQVLTDRKDTQIQAVQEQGNAYSHHQKARHQLQGVIGHGTEYQQLEHQDDDNDR